MTAILEEMQRLSSFIQQLLPPPPSSISPSPMHADPLARIHSASPPPTNSGSPASPIRVPVAVVRPFRRIGRVYLRRRQNRPRETPRRRLVLH